MVQARREALIQNSSAPWTPIIISVTQRCNYSVRIVVLYQLWLIEGPFRSHRAVSGWVEIGVRWRGKQKVCGLSMESMNHRIMKEVNVRLTPIAREFLSLTAGIGAMRLDAQMCDREFQMAN